LELIYDSFTVGDEQDVVNNIIPKVIDFLGNNVTLDRYEVIGGASLSTSLGDCVRLRLATHPDSFKMISQLILETEAGGFLQTNDKWDASQVYARRIPMDCISPLIDDGSRCMQYIFYEESMFVNTYNSYSQLALVQIRDQMNDQLQVLMGRPLVFPSIHSNVTSQVTSAPNQVVTYTTTQFEIQSTELLPFFSSSSYLSATSTALGKIQTEGHMSAIASSKMAPGSLTVCVTLDCMILSFEGWQMDYTSFSGWPTVSSFTDMGQMLLEIRDWYFGVDSGHAWQHRTNLEWLVVSPTTLQTQQSTEHIDYSFDEQRYQAYFTFNPNATYSDKLQYAVEAQKLWHEIGTPWALTSGKNNYIASPIPSLSSDFDYCSFGAEGIPEAGVDEANWVFKKRTCHLMIFSDLYSTNDMFQFHRGLANNIKNAVNLQHSSVFDFDGLEILDPDLDDGTKLLHATLSAYHLYINRIIKSEYGYLAVIHTVFPVKDNNAFMDAMNDFHSDKTAFQASTLWDLYNVNVAGYQMPLKCGGSGLGVSFKFFGIDAFIETTQTWNQVKNFVENFILDAGVNVGGTGITGVTSMEILPPEVTGGKWEVCARVLGLGFGSQEIWDSMYAHFQKPNTGIVCPCTGLKSGGISRPFIPSLTPSTSPQPSMSPSQSGAGISTNVTAVDVKWKRHGMDYQLSPCPKEYFCIIIAILDYTITGQKLNSMPNDLGIWMSEELGNGTDASDFWLLDVDDQYIINDVIPDIAMRVGIRLDNPMGLKAGMVMQTRFRNQEVEEFGRVKAAVIFEPRASEVGFFESTLALIIFCCIAAVIMIIFAFYVFINNRYKQRLENQERQVVIAFKPPPVAKPPAVASDSSDVDKSVTSSDSDESDEDESGSSEESEDDDDDDVDSSEAEEEAAAASAAASAAAAALSAKMAVMKAAAKYKKKRKKKPVRRAQKQDTEDVIAEGEEHAKALHANVEVDREMQQAKLKRDKAKKGRLHRGERKGKTAAVDIAENTDEDDVNKYMVKAAHQDKLLTNAVRDEQATQEAAVMQKKLAREKIKKASLPGATNDDGLDEGETDKRKKKKKKKKKNKLKDNDEVAIHIHTDHVQSTQHLDDMLGELDELDFSEPKNAP
jgi:hypothetical protein